MSFVDERYIQNAITAELCDAFFPSADELQQAIELADARVTFECHRAGYGQIDPATPPSGVAGNILKGASLYVVISVGALRRNLEVSDAIMRGLIDPARIGSGEFPLPGLVPSKLQGVGGGDVRSTVASGPTMPGESGPVFTRRSLWGF